jgi:hypothetical protein
VREQLDQALAVGRARLEVGQRQRQFEVAAHGHQPARQRQEIERAAQVVADAPPMSAAAAMTPSSEPYCASHLTAVLAPTLSTPGTLSTVSPISAR